jgi:hypothetical protein
MPFGFCATRAASCYSCENGKSPGEAVPEALLDPTPKRPFVHIPRVASCTSTRTKALLAVQSRLSRSPMAATSWASSSPARFRRLRRVMRIRLSTFQQPLLEAGAFLHASTRRQHLGGALTSASSREPGLSFQGGATHGREKSHRANRWGFAESWR